MDEAGFKNWLETRGLAEKSVSTRMSAVRRIERALADLGISHPDLDEAYSSDTLEAVSASLQRLKVDAEQSGQRYRVLLPESGTPVSRLDNFIAWLGNYKSFKEGRPAELDTAADRIREHVFENYIVPARERGDAEVEVKVRDVHDALGLSLQWANVCQAVSGSKFQAMAGVVAPRRYGAEASPATSFIFELRPTVFSMEAVEQELTRRFVEPITDTKKILAFRLADGREIALDRERPPAQVWLEERSVPDEFHTRTYAPDENRHSGLPPRLKHDSRPAPRPVTMVRVGSMAELIRLLDWYAGRAVELNRERLEQYKRSFLARYPDFEPAGFRASTGGYFAEERAYKDILIERTRVALVELRDTDDTTLGGRLLDILTGQAGAPSNLLGWRTNARIKELRKAHPGILEREAGRLARAEEVSAAISECVEATWPILSEGQTSKPYSESRNIPTMLAALAHPHKAYGINSDPIQRISMALTDSQAFRLTPLAPAEYANVLVLIQAIKIVMVEEWNWAPRDLWDIQGFIWAVSRPDSPQTSIEAAGTLAMPSFKSPTNLILYGPPGTGKTFATAREAVLLCNGSASDDRTELMAEYARLTAARRIEFVTFHQSYSYEEFVEGLRPSQGEGTSADAGSANGGDRAAGFQLVPEPGVFRLIARRAETSTGPGSSDFKVGNRQVFKMSIGEAANPDDAFLFEEALQGGYTLLGFEDIDWSDDRFESRDEIIEACRQREGSESGQPNASSGRVQCPYIFRNGMHEDDVVIVSKGNRLFRAIGVVTGGYQYAPREDGSYSHRRPVRWLWHDKAGVPVEEIYARGFSMRSVYLLTHADLNIPALERYIASQQPAAGKAPEPFVLIIDEINRANISKVLGELITLLEPDKRLGGPNELRVRLPYSRDMFGVPANLHIIGTMNTADRSIALLDTALRRRFQFRELMPQPDILSEASATCGINLVKMLTVLNERIEYLFDREHQLGHAYFIECRSRSDVDRVMRQKMIPLLAEYFYEDWSKVASVLGETEDAGQFLQRTTLKAPNGFNTEEASVPRYRWSVKEPFASDCYDQFQ